MRFACLVIAGLSTAQPPDLPPAASRLEVVAPREVGIHVTAINGRGEVIGFEWAEEPDNPDILEQVPFFARGKELIRLPRLAGYTATFPAGLSDDGLVVGRVSKPAPPGVRVRMRNQAFVWDAAGGIRGLGTLPGDLASFATGVTRDGRRIAGVSVGDNRIRACLWEKHGDGWTAVPIPQADRLGSNVVAISGGGGFLASVDGAVACLWTRGDAPGEWVRKPLGGPGAFVPRAVNDQGMVVGLRHADDGTTHAVVWTTEAGLVTLTEPEGFVRSEATAVNNHGVVVGMVDGPNGSEIGPRAFAYERGRLRLIDEGGPAFTAATAINDRGQVAGVLEVEEAAPPPDPAPNPTPAPNPAPDPARPARGARSGP